MTRVPRSISQRISLAHNRASMTLGKQTNYKPHRSSTGAFWNTKYPRKFSPPPSTPKSPMPKPSYNSYSAMKTPRHASFHTSTPHYHHPQQPHVTVINNNPPLVSPSYSSLLYNSLFPTRRYYHAPPILERTVVVEKQIPVYPKTNAAPNFESIRSKVVNETPWHQDNNKLVIATAAAIAIGVLIYSAAKELGSYLSDNDELEQLKVDHEYSKIELEGKKATELEAHQVNHLFNLEKEILENSAMHARRSLAVISATLLGGAVAAFGLYTGQMDWFRRGLQVAVGSTLVNIFVQGVRASDTTQERAANDILEHIEEMESK